MRLNSLKPAKGSKFAPKRVGRGIGSTLGKTCGRGHKGQHARAGGFHKLGFEGGQSPLHRRLPKFGFRTPMQRRSRELHLTVFNKLDDTVIDLDVLKRANLVNDTTTRVKVVATGKIQKSIRLKGIKVTQGARILIEGMGGHIED